MTPSQLKFAFIAAAVFVVAGLLWTGHEREMGALRERLNVTTLAHDSAVTEGKRAALEAERAKADAATLKAAAEHEMVKDRVVQARTDSSMRASADERIRAERVLADSLATVSMLHDELARAVAASRRDSVVFATARSQHDRTVASLLATIHADSLALRAQEGATEAALKRATLSEAQVAILLKQVPSKLGGIVKGALYVAAGYGACKLTRC